MDEQSIRERVLAAYAQGPEAMAALVATLVAEALAEAAALRARLAAASPNSSTPPWSDGLGRKPQPKSLRERSGRPSGGQAGHAGHTLALVDTPDVVTVHPPGSCAQCGADLEGAPVVRQERRQVVDVRITCIVTEHQAQTKCCPQCGMETVGE